MTQHLDEESQRLPERMIQVARFATMGEMAAGIAHEVNQPLTAIVNYARAGERFLAAAEPNLEEVRSALSEIAAEALRAGEIIRRLRQLVGKQPSERAATDPNELVEELRVLVMADARMHNTRVRFDLAPGLPRIYVDRMQIQHAILNLLHNAFEALEEAGAGEVTIRTSSTAQGEVEFSICDNGPGPAQGILDRMFEPFTTTKATGTGLGLPISRTIVRAHGGQIDYRPAGGSGACFYIRIPRLEAE